MAVTATLKKLPSGGTVERLRGQRARVTIEVTGDGVGGAVAVKVPLNRVDLVAPAAQTAAANLTATVSGRTVTVTATAALAAGAKAYLDVEGV